MLFVYADDVDNIIEGFFTSHEESYSKDFKLKDEKQKKLPKLI